MKMEECLYFRVVSLKQALLICDIDRAAAVVFSYIVLNIDRLIFGSTKSRDYDCNPNNV